MSFHGLGMAGLGAVDVVGEGVDAGTEKFKAEIKSGDYAAAAPEGLNTAGRTAAATGGAAAGVAACALVGVSETGVGAVFCASVGAAIGKFFYDELGPFLDDVGHSIKSLFSSDSAAEQERARRAQQARVLDIESQLHAIESGAGGILGGVYLLREAIAHTVTLYRQLGLPGTYGWDEVTKRFAALGLPLEPYRSTKPATMGQVVTSWQDPFTNRQVNGAQLTAPYWFERWAPYPPFRISDLTLIPGSSWVKTGWTTPKIPDPTQANCNIVGTQTAEGQARWSQCAAAATVMVKGYDSWIRKLQYVTAQEMAALGARAAALYVEKQMAQAEREAKTAHEKFDATAASAAVQQAHPIRALLAPAPPGPQRARQVALVGTGAFAGAFALTWLLKR